MGEMSNAYLKTRDSLGDFGIDGRAISKRNLKERACKGLSE
jgi:hypothetical protein